MKKYPEKFLVMLDNMIALHFNYDEMYEQIQISFPKIKITFDEMLDIIQDRIINMI
jgi:hypothetical protein